MADDVLRSAEHEIRCADRSLRIAREWLSKSHYATKYGVARHTVYKWLRSGLLETYTVGELTRIKDLPPDQHRPC